MIISPTPYRVSFAGGGTDLPAFYREEPGAVLARDLAGSMRHALCGAGDLDGFAKLLHEGWGFKRSLGGISNAQVDSWYETARRNGALGGKLLGAGGGGFLLLQAPADRHERIMDALGRPRRLDFHIDPHGTRCIYVDH